jgi:hypothetical protein
MGVPPNHLKLDHFSIETYGFGDPTLLRSLRMYILYTHTHLMRFINQLFFLQVIHLGKLR